MWNDQLATEREYKSKKELKEKVKSVVGNPLNKWVVAASLESLGIREQDADEYGYASLFELAEALFF